MTRTAYCIADGCGRGFDPGQPEPRDPRRLVAFWQRYCPTHRQADGKQIHISEVGTFDLADMEQLAQASDQFFDEALRPELVKLEAEAVMQDLATAIPTGTEANDVRAAANLLARLRAEAAMVRTDLAALERTAREIEQLERMMFTDER